MKKYWDKVLIVLILVVIGVFSTNRKENGVIVTSKSVIINGESKIIKFINGVPFDTSGVISSTPNQALVISHTDTTSWWGGGRYGVRRYGLFANKSLKQWDTVLTISSSSGFSVGYSYVGFTTTPMIFAIAMRNTSTGYQSPDVAAKTISTTAATFNFTGGNNNLVTILGLSVLNGAGTTFDTDPTSITLIVTAIGY